MYVHEACSMVHHNDLAQAEALVAQETARQARKATALEKKYEKGSRANFKVY